MQLIIFSGVQASGKSTFYKQYFYTTHLRLNLDMLKTRHRENILFEAALASKTKLVIDNTNPDRESRARYIQRAIDAGFEVIAYYFETDLDSTLARNRLRQGKANIPEAGVRATYKKIQVPQCNEGFTEIFKVKIIAQGEFSILPILD
ncbi:MULTISPECIES: ATP-binding protein [Acinetobacter]|jgi:predicted kinase|uniref:ATP-binding protein n=1 Tax=Acinetobacter chengduensis TaxID=2420890 RepID=A0ABX9TX34_9GAMM|nr:MULTISPECIES: ATP-binding protein [Acinetobacter]MBI1452686.1 AAA family ATPase [Acinetobacter sp. FL51]RKG39171.1 ATP-binding protein [Acinetobacter sp. WCHAc060007]RLL21873.1 ATP-binding protein [Acinetobacter chengduensis]